MPIQIPQFPILSPEQANPLGHGIKQGVDIYNAIANNAVARRQQELQNEEMQKKMPFVEDLQRALLSLKQQESDQYTPNIQSEISARSASSNLHNKQSQQIDFGLKNPGLGSAGPVGELAFASYLAQNPQLLETLNKSRSGNNANETNNENPIDYLMNRSKIDADYKKALTNSINDNLSARSFDKLPMAEKQYAIAQARAFGLTAEEAARDLRKGKTLKDIADANGYGKNEDSWPLAQGAPTTATQTRLQRSNAALAGLNAVEPLMRKAYSEYGTRFHGISPELLKDMVSGSNVEKQSDAFAARALAPEYNSLRIASQQGNVGIGALKHLEDTSYQFLNTLKLSPSSEVYKRTLDKISKAINKINHAENRAVYQFHHEQPQESDNSDLSNLSDDELRRIAGE